MISPASQVFEAVALGGRRPPVPASMPQSLALLMQRCWAEDPDERPHFGTVLDVLRLIHDADDEAAIAAVAPVTRTLLETDAHKSRTTTSGARRSKGAAANSGAARDGINEAALGRRSGSGDGLSNECITNW